MQGVKTILSAKGSITFETNCAWFSVTIIHLASSLLASFIDAVISAIKPYITGNAFDLDVEGKRTYVGRTLQILRPRPIFRYGWTKILDTYYALIPLNHLVDYKAFHNSHFYDSSKKAPLPFLPRIAMLCFSSNQS